MLVYSYRDSHLNVYFYILFQQIGLITLLNMNDDLSSPLLTLKKANTQKSKNKKVSKQKVNTQSPRKDKVPTNQLVIEKSFNLPSSHNELEWQNSSQQIPLKQSPPANNKRANKKQVASWSSNKDEQIQKTLNHKVFNLNERIQRVLYYFNFLMNIIMRVLFILLLTYLGLQNKPIYMYIFLSLELTAMLLYLIVMIKLLFTRSDDESVKFQKVFHQTDWTDISEERVMRRHFSLVKIISKIITFFNPRHKFGKNIKISFLRQEIFKRMELILVYIPFSVMFFINQNDFTAEGYPNSQLYITMAIILEIIRTTITYLAIYIFS